jgi:hypothetical protein
MSMQLYEVLLFHQPHTDLKTACRKIRTWVRDVELDSGSELMSFSNRTAYMHGLNFCTGDFVIIMDADFSHHVCHAITHLHGSPC